MIPSLFFLKQTPALPHGETLRAQFAKREKSFSKDSVGAKSTISSLYSTHVTMIESHSLLVLPRVSNLRPKPSLVPPIMLSWSVSRALAAAAESISRSRGGGGGEGAFLKTDGKFLHLKSWRKKKMNRLILYPTSYAHSSAKNAQFFLRILAGEAKLDPDLALKSLPDCLPHTEKSISKYFKLLWIFFNTFWACKSAVYSIGFFC